MRKLWFVVALCLLSTSAHSAAKLTYADLVNRLIDMEALSILPQAGEECAQWSSYERASVYDESTGQYLKWDANDDWVGFIRMEGTSQVLAEIDGPGVIWRIWSAMPAHANVKIYLDGSPTPVVDMPFTAYFDLKHAPFTYPSLVYVTARGNNSYIPIPFQKSCKIVGDEKYGRYYHFTYTKFPEGTQVPTFKRNLSASDRAALAKVDRYLTEGLGTDPAGKRDREMTISRKIYVRPGATSRLARVNGERAITAIRVKVDESAIRDVPAALRSAVLSIKWDNEEEPSVWVPLGDFFGSAPGINKYKSLPLGKTDDGFYSFWYMPFAKRAEVELINEGGEVLPMEFSITHAPLTRPVEEYTRFHAKWHRDAFLPGDHVYRGVGFKRDPAYDPEYESGRSIDWTMLITEGRGRFCGVMLEVWNPKGGWWGEGDEKFFVDGEKFPSTFGTGSEDYFGYAWGDPAFFEAAYHNQPRNDDNRGHISNNRWQIADNVPFQKSFEGYMEKYFGNDRPTLFACTAYWYLAPGGKDPFGSVPLSERFFYVNE